MKRRREAGYSVVALLLLLAIAAGAGAWNYKRNAEAEEDVYRPFQGYTDQALADLADAYEGRQKGDQKRFDQASTRRVAAEDKDYFDQQVREFERVQRAHAGKQEARARMAESKTTLKLLEEEQRLRASERDKLALFLKRLLTI
jgi:hypothetical protein